MTLSYRWSAEVRETRLMQNNKGIYYESIPTSTWPQIYHDAVSVARHFDTRYLWIDALCIIQDDSDDWKEQSALMDIIYERGVLNLAGIMGEKADGLRVCRDPLRVFRCALSHPSGETWELYDPVDEGIYVEDTLENAPLYKRGWTFQERVLSMRTLHFGPQLVWECSMCSTTENSSETSFPPAPTPSSVLKGALRNFDSSRVAKERLADLWQRAVATFSKMELTKPSDKLPALQGIVNRFGHSLNMDPIHYYIAGLWLFDSNQLAWFRIGKRDWLTTKDDDLARELSLHHPSWSWAISTEEIHFTDFDSAAQLVIFGADRGRGAAGLRSITVDKCVSFVTLDNASSPLGTATSVAITLQGKFIHWLNIRKALKLWQPETHYFQALCGVPYPGGISLLQVLIMLDRPVPDSNMTKGMKLLPIWGCRDTHVGGILVVFCGFHDGLAVYRRLGYFEVRLRQPSSETLIHYLSLPNEPPKPFSGPTRELRRDFDEFPPFKLI
ncbi:heterokaryon incompatibility protein-domain-containing protein [Sordaria brevicollis]|uniref:Heterokaryon incompatibility protein-domain-containing protein n=1 Tax=Sordaria brevicollis TaxID=83679 RepID=A0AAE0UAE4_SORBR|nr:heterokaryon incompatibility protein-domain-containing protein [Sordaria brevicollis]